MSNACRWQMGVLIPARNEELLLPRCLDSVLAAKEHVSDAASVSIVVVADKSVDRTAAIALEMLKADGAVCRIAAGCVGTARRKAAEVFLKRHKPLKQCWLANTDADCVVPKTWLSDQLRLAQNGVEAVAGTVSVDSFEEHGAEVASRFRATYQLEPDGTHKHVHGANLGVGAESYVRAGGWRDLATAEDHDLWRRLALVGARRFALSRLQVVTSGRRAGRAPHGFADALTAHNESAA